MGITDTVDPLAGSYYVETLTNQFEAAIRREMAAVDAAGGVVQAISNGRVQARVAQQAYAHELGLRDGSIPKVGVNRYVEDEDERDVAFHPYDEAGAARKIAGLRRIRAQRDQAEVERCLAGLRAAAEAGDNVMPASIAAVKAYATVGEITAVLKSVYGDYQEPGIF